MDLPMRGPLSRLRHYRQAWQCFCIFGLSATYGLFLLFASLCSVATLLPADTHHNTPHHHTTPDAQHSSTLPDACACVLQGLMPTALPAMYLLACVAAISVTLSPSIGHFPYRLACGYTSIRAPPVTPS
jgi:hypothetical protein